MQTAVDIYFHGLRLRCSYDPGDPGQYGGGPDSWRQPEGAEVEIESVAIEDREEWDEFTQDREVPSVATVALGTWLTDKFYGAICDACEEAQ